MKKMLLLAMAMFLVGLFVGSVALAQGGITVIDGTTMIVDLAPGAPGFPTMQAAPTAPLAPSGGPSVLLPGAALLLGTGVLTYSVLRRRR